MKVKLTQSFIDNQLQCPEGVNRIEYCDADLPGLYVLVGTAGKVATYFLRYKDKNSKTSHQKIGRTTDITLLEAKNRVKVLKAEIVANGADPRAEQKARKAVLTFSEFFEQHYIPHAKRFKRSWQRDVELYRRLKDAFGKKRLNQITRHEIMTFHGSLPDQGLAPATCDHHLKLMKHALNLAIDWEFLHEKNPATRVPQFSVPNAVQNLLSDDQVSRLLEILRTDKNRTLCQIVTVLLGSGARVSEALKAKWVHIDTAKRQWTVPTENSKGKRPRIIEITDVVLDVLNSLGTEGKYDYLFVNKKRGGQPFTTISKSWTRLRARAGLPHLRLHDCRHLYITWILEGGASLFQAAQLAGHRSQITTQRYAHLSKSVLQGAANNASLKIKGVLQSSPPVSSIQDASDSVAGIIKAVPQVSATEVPA